MNAAGGDAGGGPAAAAARSSGAAPPTIEPRLLRNGRGAGLAALDPATGETAWMFAPPPPAAAAAARSSAPRRPRSPAWCSQGASERHAIRGVGGRRQRALGVRHVEEFETVNKVPAHGGAIASSGAVVVDGMLFVGSGYAVGSGATAATRCSRSACANLHRAATRSGIESRSDFRSRDLR